jgi:DNA-binding MarR family transcriptional regulator
VAEPAESDRAGERAAAIDRIMRNQKRITHLFAFDRSDPLLTAHLTMPQFRVLLVLALRGGNASHDLAASMGVSLATITGIVDRLSAQDLVTRREDQRDRRVRRVELTPAGQELIDGIVAAGANNQRRLLARLDPDQLATVERALGIMITAAEAERAEAAEPEPTE